MGWLSELACIGSQELTLVSQTLIYTPAQASGVMDHTVAHRSMELIYKLVYKGDIVEHWKSDEQGLICG